MIRNQRILVGLSLTPHDAPIIRYVRMLCESGIGRQIHFLHVIATDRPAEEVAAARTQLDAAVAADFGPAIAGIDVSSTVAIGICIDSLLEAATRTRTDIILIGHRRERSGQRSLARRLAMIAPCSVWLIPEGSPTTARRLLVPVDFSDNSGDALSQAAALSRSFNAQECLALHVTFDPSSIRYPEHVAELELAHDEAFRRFLLTVETFGVDVSTLCEEGPDPAPTILRIADERHSDLIVMNTRGRSRAAAVLLGSVTTRVLAETHIPLLAVKHFGAMLGLFDVLRDRHFWTDGTPKTN